MNKASSVKNLKKRIDYFFDDTNRQQAPLVEFVKKKLNHFEPFLFGGVIRDLALHGLNSFKSDVDIVCLEDIDTSCFECEVYKNKFGGYRVLYGRWIVDLWKAEDTWSFAEGYFPFHGIESLLETTQTNFESALYDINSKRLICREGYFDDLSEGYLSIVNPKSPNREKMFSKIIKSAYHNNVVTCDQNISDLAADIFKTYGLFDFYHDYMEYLVPYLYYDFFVKKLLCHNGEILPIDVSWDSDNQKELFF